MELIINKIKAFLADETGAETVEWVMIVALLTAITLAVYNIKLNTALVAVMAKITARISTAAGGGGHGGD